jgi:hypothetical protein
MLLLSHSTLAVFAQYSTTCIMHALCFVKWPCRASYEQLLLKYKVDLVFSGHTHAYERTKPIANYQVGQGLCL